MTNSCSASLATVGLISLLAGCDLLSPDDPPTPYFHATIQGAIHVEYEGTGTFSWGTLPEETMLVNVSSSNDDADEHFYVQIFLSSGRAPAGSYTVTLEPHRLRELRARGDAGPGWISVLYRREQQDGPAEYYVADGGTIEITDSRAADYSGYMNNDHGWLEGSFSISAVRYCGGLEGVDYHCPRLSDLPDRLPADLPRVDITGSFVVTAADNRLYTDCDPICEYKP